MINGIENLTKSFLSLSASSQPSPSLLQDDEVLKRDTSDKREVEG